jgi:hypothetical protein
MGKDNAFYEVHAVISTISMSKDSVIGQLFFNHSVDYQFEVDNQMQKEGTMVGTSICGLLLQNIQHLLSVSIEHITAGKHQQ